MREAVESLLEQLEMSVEVPTGCTRPHPPCPFCWMQDATERNSSSQVLLGMIGYGIRRVPKSRLARKYSRNGLSNYYLKGRVRGGKGCVPSCRLYRFRRTSSRILRLPSSHSKHAYHLTSQLLRCCPPNCVRFSNEMNSSVDIYMVN